MKEVKKQWRSKNFYLSIIHKIKQGKIPAQIKNELGISKQNLNYYIATLKRNGCIKNLAYGVWEYVKDFDLKEVKKTVVIGKDSRHSLKPDTVRGHGFLFKLRLISDTYDIRVLSELAGINVDYFYESAKDWDALSENDPERDILFNFVLPKLNSDKQLITNFK